MEFNATFIVAFVSFIVFVIVMNKILYEPISNIVLKREKLIDENYSLARKNQEKSKAILDDRLDKLNNAKSRVKEETAVALNKAKEEQKIAQDGAKIESKDNIDKNIDKLNNEKLDAINILKNDVINLAQAISDKFIDTQDRISDVDMNEIEKIMQD